MLKDKVSIKKWLNQYNVKGYDLIESEKYGYVVNVSENVYLSRKGLTSIDVKFNKIEGDFDCSDNDLKSLEGCPEIVDGNFLF